MPIMAITTKSSTNVNASRLARLYIQVAPRRQNQKLGESFIKSSSRPRWSRRTNRRERPTRCRVQPPRGNQRANRPRRGSETSIHHEAESAGTSVQRVRQGGRENWQGPLYSRNR